MTPEYAIITILGVILSFFGGAFLTQIKVGNKVAQHEIKITENEAAINRLCNRIDAVIAQNSKIIEQNSLVIMKLNLEDR